MSKKYLEGTKIEDLTGMKFGRLEVIEFDRDRYENDKVRKLNSEIKQIHKTWICKCECGNIKSVNSGSLKSGNTKSCGCLRDEVVSINSSKVKFKSFQDWCLENGYQYYLELWDYELNEKRPDEVNWSSHKKYYFKCSKGIHNSGLWQISSIANLYSTISCRKCNSIGQYLKDTYGDLCMWIDDEDCYSIPRGRGNKKYKMKCIDCGEIKSISPNMFTTGGLACKCGDGISYPNKFVYSLLKQIDVSYINEKNFYWSNGKVYDLYIPFLNTVIENHGEQHYGHGFNGLDGRTLEEEQFNDRLKKELALSNGIEYYIELDCRKSELEWIKNSVMNSELPMLLNFKEEDIDWVECDKFATKNLVKEVCDTYMRAHPITTKELADLIGVDITSIRNYLNKGTKLGWCNYDAKIGRIGKRVEVFKDDISFGIYDSISKVASISEIEFGVKLCITSISKICLNKQKVNHKGYMFRFV